MDPSSSMISQFHLGVSADGGECLMVFVDEEQRAMKCVANFSEFRAFVSGLCEIAEEMARRQSTESETLAEAEAEEEQPAVRVSAGRGLLDVASGAFAHDVDRDCIKGALVGADGNMLGLKMSPEVASQLSRALLLATPAQLAS
jgi:hypothetical protein